MNAFKEFTIDVQLSPKEIASLGKLVREVMGSNKFKIQKMAKLVVTAEVPLMEKIVKEI